MTLGEFGQQLINSDDKGYEITKFMVEDENGISHYGNVLGFALRLPNDDGMYCAKVHLEDEKCQ